MFINFHHKPGQHGLIWSKVFLFISMLIAFLHVFLHIDSFPLVPRGTLAAWVVPLVGALSPTEAGPIPATEEVSGAGHLSVRPAEKSDEQR